MRSRRAPARRWFLEGRQRIQRAQRRSRAAPRHPRPGRRQTPSVPNNHKRVAARLSPDLRRPPVPSPESPPRARAAPHCPQPGRRCARSHPQPQAKRGSPVAGSLKTASAQKSTHQSRQAPRRPRPDHGCALCHIHHHSNPRLARRRIHEHRQAPSRNLDPTPLRPSSRRQTHQSHSESGSLLATLCILGRTTLAAESALAWRHAGCHNCSKRGNPQSPSRSVITPRSRTAAMCPGPEERSGPPRRKQCRRPLRFRRRLHCRRPQLPHPQNKTASCETSTSATHKHPTPRRRRPPRMMPALHPRPRRSMRLSIQNPSTNRPSTPRQRGAAASRATTNASSKRRWALPRS